MIERPILNILKPGLLITALTFFCLGIPLFAQQQAYRSPAGTDYLLYTPPGYSSSTSTFPLLISLHSKGEVGTDLAELTSKNPEQMPSRLIYLNRWPQEYPFIVLTPQLKPEGDPERQWPADYIDEVVGVVMQNYRVDPTRVYLTGISRGGTGVWTYASAYPEKIAAIVTLSGRSDLSQACPIKDIPIWAFHGDGDTVAPPEFSIDMVNAINSCSPKGKYNAHLTILNAKAHDGWNEVYNGSNGYRVFEWLLRFRKNNFANQSPYVNAGPDLKFPRAASGITLPGYFFDADGTISSVAWTQTQGQTLSMSNANTKFLSLTNLKAGAYTFRLSATDDDGSTSSDEVNIEIIDNPTALKIDELILVNGKTNSDIGPLQEGMTIDKMALNLSEINVRAVATSDALSVRFSVNSDANTRTVNSTSPFFLKPQTTGPEWKVKNGEYVICATPFSKSTGGGTRGVSKCYRVTFSDGVEGCAGTGKIVREVWNNVTGKTVSSIPLATTPSVTEELTSFVSPSNTADNYGARIKGYVCPPSSGNYTFFISSDDNSELWLSTDDNPSNKVRIASVTGYTNRLQWDKYASQKSSAINLTAGRRYYIEALHKESTGGDHLAVGWQMPDQSYERPIPGNRLIPFSAQSNNPPVVALTSPSNGQSFQSGSPISILANASDPDGSISKVEFYNGGSKLGEDATSPYQFTWSAPQAGSFTLTARATDNKSATTTSSAITINVTGTCSATGNIEAEYWTNISGVEVSDIPVNSTPNSKLTLSLFEIPSNKGSNYGTRVRGYVCVPESGTYTFWISSDDKSELWLSTDDKSANKRKIASVTGNSTYRQWNKYPSQQSSQISLTGGVRYYIEALHKEATGVDHLSIGWQLPNGEYERPIPGTRLSPFQNSTSATASAAIESYEFETVKKNVMEIYPNPLTSKRFNIKMADEAVPKGIVNVEILSGEGKIIINANYNLDIDSGGIPIELQQELPQGLYLVRIVVGARQYQSKLVVK